MEGVKLVGVKMPGKLIDALGQIAEEQCKTISALIREIAAEYVEDELSIESWKLIEVGRKEYREGHHVPWREVINE